ncbi:MAG: hypothetical protein KAS17_12880 [Victivallaceae bacterium]|nr:hypothetical protein [Victivallaceae bacterium]
MKDNDFINAIRESIKRVGSEVKLGKTSGLKQPDINRIKNCKVPINNITIGTLRKLFPDMQIDFFGTGGRRGCRAQITQMLNSLTEQERNEIMLAIAVAYPHVVKKKFN